MFLPIILPDEVHTGYLGRLTLFMRRRDFAQAWTHLAKEFGLDRVHRPSSLALVAKIINKEIIDVLRLHTLHPLRNAFDANLVRSTPRCFDLGTEPKLYEAQTPRFCCACIEADLAEYGCSYWHRVHFIRGAEFCVHHPSSLLIDANSRSYFQNTLPHIELQKTQAADPGWLEPTARRIDASSLEFRYLKVCQSVLESVSPLTDIRSIKRIIRNAAPYRWEVQQNDHIGASELADAITLSLKSPETRIWLNAAFPRLTVDVNAFVKAITGAKVSSSDKYILACLHLGCWASETSDDAFNTWAQQFKTR